MSWCPGAAVILGTGGGRSWGTCRPGNLTRQRRQLPSSRLGFGVIKMTGDAEK